MLGGEQNMTTIRLVTAAAIAALAALGPAAAQETIKIGGLAPLSPPGGVQNGESLLGEGCGHIAIVVVIAEDGEYAVRCGE